MGGARKKKQWENKTDSRKNINLHTKRNKVKDEKNGGGSEKKTKN